MSRRREVEKPPPPSGDGAPSERAPVRPRPAIPESVWRGAILDSIADGVFTVDGDWRITYFNRAAEEITGIPRAEAIGRYCCDVFRANICEEGCCLRGAVASGESSVHNAAYIIRRDGERIPISISAAPLRNERDEVVGGVETFRNLSVVEALRDELARRYTFNDIVSKNKRMQELFDLLPQVALSDATVLLEGESGTGKELFARAIHSLGARRNGPLIALNCGAVPDTLLESELFGHVAGAFTDARKDRAGRFALAQGGTLFLDEIGDVSPALQVRLLRVLEQRAFEPLGGTETVHVDVRLVAATNRPLADLVRAGTFRADLFYRLHVVALEIPPLRERREDIPLLVEHFIGRFNRLQGKEVSHMAPEALGVLMNHPFPGNVRELLNVVEHAFVLCRGGALLREHLPAYLLGGGRRGEPPSASRPGGPEERRALAEVEAAFLREALARHGFSRAETARNLGMHRTTLWRKLKRLRVCPAEGGEE